MLLAVILTWMPHNNALSVTGPRPGDVYREYSVNLKQGDWWRVTDPRAGHPGAAAFLPNPLLTLEIDDLEDAVRAEVLMDLAFCA